MRAPTASFSKKAGSLQTEKPMVGTHEKILYTFGSCPERSVTFPRTLLLTGACSIVRNDLPLIKRVLRSLQKKNTQAQQISSCIARANLAFTGFQLIQLIHSSFSNKFYVHFSSPLAFASSDLCGPLPHLFQRKLDSYKLINQWWGLI